MSSLGRAASLLAALSSLSPPQFIVYDYVYLYDLTHPLPVNLNLNVNE
jgi:hypothetical protein